MGVIVRIAKNGVEHSGFRLSEFKNQKALFGSNAIYEGSKFYIGDYTYEVKQVVIEQIFEGPSYVYTLDNENTLLEPVIVLWCDTEDPNLGNLEVLGKMDEAREYYKEFFSSI